MAVTFDAGAKGTTSGAASLTIPITIGGTSGYAVVVQVTCTNSTDYLSGATVTVGGTSMGSPVLTPASGASNTHQYTWVLRSPPSGSVNVVITPTNAAAYLDAIVSSYAGVHATDAIVLGTAYVAVSGTSMTRSISTPANGMAVDMLTYRTTGATITPDASQTRIDTTLAGGVSTSSGSYKAAAADMTWTFASGGGIAHHVIALPPAAAGDTTPPTLTSPSGTGGALTCSGSVSTDEGNGTLYAVATASATAPSAAQVKAGQDHTGAAALRVVSQAVSGTGVQSISSGSVTAGTRYWHFMHEDSAANQSAVVSSASFTVTSGGDTTAPVLSSPVGTATGSTTATVGATTDEGNGTLYAVVTTSATQPSVAQIKAGQNHTGAAAAWAGSVAVSSTGAKTLNATGLTGSTTYYAHLVHSDAAGNDSNRVVSASFTTSAPTTAGLTSSPLKDNTGTLHLNAPFEAFVLNATTGALVVRKTGLTSNASTGVVTFTDAALTAATQYRVVWRQTTTGAQGIELLTAA